MATTKSATYPFTVRTDAGVLVKGHDKEKDAQDNAAYRNAAGEVIGIRTRYEATNKPCKKGRE